MDAILKPERSSLDITMSDSDTSTSAYKLSKKLVSTRLLIQLVRERACLWDRSDLSYRDKFAKDKAWQEIYHEFEPSFESLDPTKRHLICEKLCSRMGNLITKKWYNVRDAYVKSKKIGTRSRPYLYSEDLQFLDPIYLIDNANKKTLKEERYKDSFEERVSNDDEADNEGSQSWINEVFVNIEEGGAENSEHTAKRQKIEYNANKDVTEYDENIVTVLAHLIQKEEDEDRAFFKSITPAVKTLSENSKFQFRIQVMKLINSLKVRDKQSMKLKVEMVSHVNSDSE